MLHIYLFGGFRLLQGDELLAAVDTPRQQALLAYLLLHRTTPQLRQRLAFLFWPESSDAQAQTNLRQLLHILRRRLPNAEHYLAIDERTVQWRVDSTFTLDLADFERALAKAKQSTGPDKLAALEQAVTCYTGDLLFELYEDWILAERERLRQHFMEAIEQVIHLLEERRKFKKAIVHAQHLLRYDPLHESTYCQLMRLYALDGDRSSALRTYHTCVTLLDRELGVQPSEQTQEAYIRLLNIATSTAPNPPFATPSALVLPLIGRHAEWAALQQAWRLAMSGRSQFIILTGQAGIGKTRLAEELLVWAKQQGFLQATTRCYEMEGSLPLAPVIEWLRNVSFHPVLTSLSMAWRGELARLLPELRSEQFDLTPGRIASEHWRRTQLFDALAHVIAAVHSPLLLFIDDLQWCDSETLDWLYYLMRFRTDARLLVVGTMRPEEVDDRHPISLLSLKLQSTAQFTEIELKVLAAEETAMLAVEVAKRELAQPLLNQLLRDTGGNPLFIVETMREYIAATEECVTTGISPVSSFPLNQVKSLPPKIQAVIHSYLIRLSPPSRDLIGLAAVIGRSFTFDILSCASDCDSTTLVQYLDELRQRRVVQEQGSNAYNFSHDLIRDVAYLQLSQARRRVLHRQVAESLEKVYAANLNEISGLLAVHYDRSGLVDRAVIYYWQTLEAARQRFAQRDIMNMARQGLALIAKLPNTREWGKWRLAFSIALAGAIASIDGIINQEVLEIFTEMQHLAQQLGEKVHQYEAQRGLWGCYLNRLWITQACIQASQNLALAKEMQHPRCLRDAYCNMGLAAIVVGQFQDAVGYLEQAIAQAVPLETPPLAVFGFELGLDAPFFCASAEYLLGYPVRARKRLDAAAAHIRTLSDIFTRHMTLIFTCQAYQIGNDPGAVEKAAREAIDIGQRYDLSNLDVELFLEWSLAIQTHSPEACLRLRQHLDDYQQIENYQLTYYFGLVSQAYAAAGLHNQAIAAVDTALALSERCGETFWRAELYRLRGESLLAEGSDDPELQFQQSLRIARQQSAKLLELRTAVSLGRLWRSQGKYIETQQLVAGVYSWFSEGFDTPDLAAARELLSKNYPVD